MHVKVCIVAIIIGLQCDHNRLSVTAPGEGGEGGVRAVVDERVEPAEVHGRLAGTPHHSHVCVCACVKIRERRQGSRFPGHNVRSHMTRNTFAVRAHMHTYRHILKPASS